MVYRTEKKYLYDLLELQKNMETELGSSDYNVFIFGSYLTMRYEDGKSDIDIAVYSEDFNLYKRLSCYLEAYYNKKGIDSDIFYVDITMPAPIYCVPLNSKVQFTDYYPEKLVEFKKKCQIKLEENKVKVAG